MAAHVDKKARTGAERTVQDETEAEAEARHPLQKHPYLVRMNNTNFSCSGQPRPDSNLCVLRNEFTFAALEEKCKQWAAEDDGRILCFKYNSSVTQDKIVLERLVNPDYFDDHRYWKDMKSYCERHIHLKKDFVQLWRVFRPQPKTIVYLISPQTNPEWKRAARFKSRMEKGQFRIEVYDNRQAKNPSHIPHHDNKRTQGLYDMVMGRHVDDNKVSMVFHIKKFGSAYSKGNFSAALINIRDEHHRRFFVAVFKNGHFNYNLSAVVANETYWSTMHHVMGELGLRTDWDHDAFHGATDTDMTTLRAEFGVKSETKERLAVCRFMIKYLIQNRIAGKEQRENMVKAMEQAMKDRARVSPEEQFRTVHRFLCDVDVLPSADEVPHTAYEYVAVNSTFTIDTGLRFKTDQLRTLEADADDNCGVFNHKCCYRPVIPDVPVTCKGKIPPLGIFSSGKVTLLGTTTLDMVHLACNYLYDCVENYWKKHKIVNPRKEPLLEENYHHLQETRAKFESGRLDIICARDQYDEEKLRDKRIKQTARQSNSPRVGRALTATPSSTPTSVLGKRPLGAIKTEAASAAAENESDLDLAPKDGPISENSEEEEYDYDDDGDDDTGELDAMIRATEAQLGEG